MPHNNLCYQFGPYELDVSERVLTRDGEIISLAPKATEILVKLLANAGQLVTKDELLREVWPDTFVEESNLTQNIFTLRRILGDERSSPRYIETVTRRGYRFVASVKVVDGNDQRGEGMRASIAEDPVVAVLPFINMTGDSELEYLADGVTDNLIINLSRSSKLHVMSHSAVAGYTGKDMHPQRIGKELGVSAVLVGKINCKPTGLGVSVELVDVSTGWQLWGESFDSENKDILEIQDAITRRLLTSLRLKLTGEEEKRLTARYTQSSEAYQAYLEGRYNWSKYTRKGIEKAISHFRNAIDLDPNYALAYSAIIDCYLRLATNYLPPEDISMDFSTELISHTGESNRQGYPSKIKLRFEWDWKGAERELKRANELRTEYPTAHQWYATYKTAEQLYEVSHGVRRSRPPKQTYKSPVSQLLTAQLETSALTAAEQIQVYCAIAREQMDAGNYEAARRMLTSWWSFGDWPKLDGLRQQSCADLLFTVGQLASYLANTTQLPRGQKHAEQLLNGSIALFEQLGFSRRAAEGRIELALCYYRQGLFDLGRSTLTRVLDQLSDETIELRGLALIRLAALERHSGRLKDALTRLTEAMPLVQVSGPWITARCYLELASTYKDLAASETNASYAGQAKHFYIKALSEFEAVGQHRYAAVVENNLGFLLLNVGSYEDSEKHLLRALKSFKSFSDSVAAAQVNETLARLYIETERYALAEEVIQHAVKTLEQTDGEALLAEAVTTSGLVAAKQRRYVEAKKNFEAAYYIAERCGDNEGAGRALLIMLEELGAILDQKEKVQLSTELERLLASTQQESLRTRLKRLL